MAIRALTRHVREAWEVPRDLLLRRYPAFVTGGPLPRGHVPVFCFHSVEPVSFERKLRHLVDNGYLTLSADEYFAVLLGARAAPERAVVLTFDDGRASVWTVARPLLQRFGLKGIVFLVPGRTVSRPGPRRPDWDDVRRGTATEAEVLGREEGPEALLSWEEVEELARGAVFDFQSHSHRHARVQTGGRIVDFLAPAQRRGYAALDVPLFDSPAGDLLAEDAPLGTPILHSAPRLSEAVRFHDDGLVRARCEAHVAAQGGEAFFARPGWRAELRRVARGPIRGRSETREEREAAIRHELGASRAAIEAHTGRPVLHVCYPWHACGPTARRIAREVGYRTAFAGKVAGVPITLPGGDLESIARVGEDYVELLPGRGRSTLGSVLRHKWARRLARLAARA